MAYIIEKLFMLAIVMVLTVPAGAKITTFGITLARSTLLTGTVTKQGLGKFTGCKPFIEFIDPSGHTHEFKSRINYHFFFCPRPGDRITILSEKKDPAKAYVFSFTQQILIPVLLLVLGGFVLIRAFGASRPATRRTSENMTSTE